MKYEQALSSWNRIYKAVFESFFKSRVSIGYPQKRKRKRKAFITQRIKPKWKRDCGMAACV